MESQQVPTMTAKTRAEPCHDLNNVSDVEYEHSKGATKKTWGAGGAKHNATGTLISRMHVPDSFVQKQNLPLLLLLRANNSNE